MCNLADFAAVQSVMRVAGMNIKGVFTRSRQPKMAAHVFLIMQWRMRVAFTDFLS